MPATIHIDDCLLPDGLYPIAKFRQVSGLSVTTIWRIEHEEGIKLPRVKSGGKVFVRGSDGIAFLEERARRQAESEAQ